MICDRCLKPIENPDEHGLYLCPLEQRPKSTAIWADAIPGGIEIAHGLCHADGTPKRYDSRSEIKAACQEKGLVPYHEVFAEGGNKRLEDARHRDDWLKSGTAAKEKRWRDDARREKRH